MTTSAPETPGGARIVALDGLRGVAALAVLLHHLLFLLPGVSDLALEPGTPLPEAGTGLWYWAATPGLAPLGLLAVYVFFVLSGMVVTLPALRPGFDWLAYYPRRFVRLMLPVVASLVLAWVLMLIAASLPPAEAQSGWAAYSSSSTDPRLVISGAELLYGDPRLNNVLWSLRWELLFSLALPLYVIVAVLVRRWWVLAIGGCLVIVSLSHVIGGPVWLYLPIFLIGATLAVVLPKLVEWADGLPRPALVAVAVSALLVVVLLLTARGKILSWLPPGTVFDAISQALPVVVATIVVLVAALLRPAGKVLSTAPVRWLGRVSFSLYLVHVPVILLVDILLNSLPWVARAPIAAVAALVIAELFSRLVEMPSHRLSRLVGHATRRRFDRAYPAAD
jgi:peptidoglycan/LPS O-acetylase OafA/YrhL